MTMAFGWRLSLMKRQNGWTSRKKKKKRRKKEELTSSLKASCCYQRLEGRYRCLGRLHFVKKGKKKKKRRSNL